MSDKEIKKEVERISAEEPLVSLRNSIYDFFKSRLNKIENEGLFKGVVKEKILQKIEDDELSVPQLIGLYNDVVQAENSSIYALLDIFKPSKEGAVSPLANEVSSTNKPLSEGSAVSPEDAEALNLLTSLIKNAQKVENKES